MAVAFDAKTATWTDASGVTTVTISNLTVGSGSSRGLVAGIFFDTISVPSGLTAVWDSGGTNQSMTAITGAVVSDSSSNTSGLLFGLVAPTSGNKSLVISWTGATNVEAFATSFTGVDQTSVAVAFPHGTSSKASTASPTTITVTSATGNMAVAMHAQQFALWGTLSGTTIATDTSGANNGTAANYDVGAATVTLTAAWTGGGSGLWDAVGSDILAAGGGATGPVLGRTAPNIFRPRQGPSRGLFTRRSTDIPSGTVATGQGASAGLGTVTGVGAALFAGQGATAGTGTAQATGQGIANSVGASAGVGTVTGVGAGLDAATAASAGTGAATGVGAARFSAVASSAGVGTATAASAVLIPDARRTIWQPGLNYNGGIPTGRTQSGSTISPIGQKATFTATTTAGSQTITVTGVTGTLAADQLVFDAALTQCFGLIASGSGGTWTFNDSCRTTATSVAMVSYGNDTTPINAALAGAAANTFVKLANGTFNIAGNGVSHRANNVTLRGTSQWTGTEITSGNMPSLSQAATTILWKADHGHSPWGCLYVGNYNNSIQWGTSVSLAADGTKGTSTITLASAYGGSVGDLVLIDQIGDSDPNIFFGNRNQLSGTFTGSLSGSNLTVSAPVKMALGVDTAFNGSFSGTTLTVNSTAATSYLHELGVTANVPGTTIFDAGSSTYYGTLVSGTYPTFTMSQTNAGTHSLVLGGVVPASNNLILDGAFSTLYGFVSGGSYPNFTLSQSNPTLSGVTLTVGGDTRRFFSRQDRPLSQIVKVTAKAGSTITFETPLHVDFLTAYTAQVTQVPFATVTGAGVEDLTLYWGLGGDGNGNLAMANCQYSWIKNVQSQFSEGTAIGLFGCYRCQATQCYMHETPSPNPGGGGYLSGMNSGTSDCLFEDNEMWMGNKVVVLRGSGGGNVVGYNYMDDPLGSGYPMSPEAGVNAGHFVGSHMELMEGNYTHRYVGDSFWGNSPWLTAFRNWITGLRAKANIHVVINTAGATTNASTAAGSNVLHFSSGDTGNVYNGLKPVLLARYGVFPAGTVVTGVTSTTVTLNNNVTGPGVSSGDQIDFWFDGTLNNYVSLQSSVSYPYADSWGRVMLTIQVGQYYTNIAGNVIGFSGQPLLSFSSGGFNYAQTSFVYENLGPSFPATGTTATAYEIGSQQDPSTNLFPTGGDATVLRQGNYDFINNSQVWHGIGGTAGSGIIVALPNSYYITSTPAFFGANPWPWVNPSTGGTTVLPAKDRFYTRYPAVPAVPPGNQVVGNVGGAAGVGTATGVGASLAAGVAASAGVGTVTGVGSSSIVGTDGVASSAGQATVTGVGASTVTIAAVAASNGLGAANGIAASLVAGVGNASGVSFAIGRSPVAAGQGGDVAANSSFFVVMGRMMSHPPPLP